MQVVNVVDCGIQLVQTPVMLQDGSVNLVDSHMYYLNGTPETSVQWNGDSVTEEPFGMSSPWDYIFKSLIDIYGVSLIGKTLTLDVTDIDGNILKVR
jgi:hypothetical protein